MVHLYYRYEQKRHYQNNADRAPAPQSRYRPEDHQGSNVSQRGETASIPYGPAIAAHSERKQWVVAENESSFNPFLNNTCSLMKKDNNKPKYFSFAQRVRQISSSFLDMILRSTTSTPANPASKIFRNLANDSSVMKTKFLLTILPAYTLTN
ncbi:MAG: hypothetical protein V4469_02125 [Patescibacteria group bacterium]